jgi:hypothetical protein
MEKPIEDGLRRVRSLCGSLDCLIDCAMTIEEDSAHLAACVFMLTEMKDAIAALEDAMRGWSVIQPPAND